MNKRTLSWKEGKVISVEIVEGLFTLAQMIHEPYVVFFNLFTDKNEWQDSSVAEKDILFCHAVTRQFFKKTNVFEQPNIKPVADYKPPEVWLHVTGAKKIKVHLPSGEREIITLAEEKLLVEKNILKQEKYKHPSGIYDEVLKKVSTIEETKTYELTTVEVYPNLNERLRLCHQLNKNVDPIKEIIFEKEIPEAYEVFVNIISGSIPLKDLGY